jgi:hypothetical protein
MNKKLSDAKRGDKIEVHTWTGEIQSGTIVGFGEKNGMLVINYKTATGGGQWCYEDQVLSIR